jgi:hypothetical protein
MDLSGFSYLQLNTECMKFLECDLEKIIMKADNMDLYDRGLPIQGIKKNQVRIGNYGIADIITYSKEPIIDYNRETKKSTLTGYVKTITVYELKQDKVSLSTFAQALNYMRGVHTFLKKKGRDVEDYYFKIIMVGRNLDKTSSFCYIPDLFSNAMAGSVSVEIYLYDYDIDGIVFKDVCNYDLIEKGF